MSTILLEVPRGAVTPPGTYADLREQTDMTEATARPRRTGWEGLPAEQRQIRMAGLIRSNRENSPRRLYRFDEHYFDAIDTPEKAYWLGFIAGDGAITNGGLRISLAEKDSEHLVSLSGALQSPVPLRRYLATLKGKQYPCATFRATSWRMVEALASHGIHPRKSLTLEPWDGPAELMPHYWRGLVDADGHIGAAPHWGIQLVGTKSVVTAFREWALSIEPSVVATARPHKAIWRFSVGGRVNSQPVARALYLPGFIALPRKAERAAALIASGPAIRGTEAWRENLRMKMKGRVPSQANRDAHSTPEARERARQRGLGRVASEETRRKMSESHRRRIEAQREGGK